MLKVKLKNLKAALFNHAGLAAALISAASLIVFVWLYTERFGNKLSSDHRIWAEFGDTFGGLLGGIFTLLALFVLIATLDIQKRELAATRSIISQQKFESTFFELLKSFNDQVHSLSLPRAGPAKVGKVLISEQAQEIKTSIYRGDNIKDKSLIFLQHLHDNHPIFQQQEMNELLWNFTLISDFIISSELAAVEKYVDILTAYISQDGLTLLICHALCSTKNSLDSSSAIVKLDIISQIRDNKIKQFLGLAYIQSLS
jgi:hypothetical protein